MIALSPEQREAFAWLDAPHLKKVVGALEATAPGAARFVGGCVRDSLLGEKPKDFDLATELSPQAVIEAVKAAGLRAVPTGLDHGTVTVIADHQGVEVTTLRADVETDGRHADVAFTTDWDTDSARRDFTINAIFLTPDGALYDPQNGLADIKARQVRFIGEAGQRIEEDYLRILRFFRFSARFAGAFDADGLAACAALSDGISTLSKERIGAEVMAILRLPRASFALSAMAQSGVLEKVWPADPDIEAVDRLKTIAPGAEAPVVLAALFGANAEGVGAALRLSNAEKAMRMRALSGVSAIKPGLDGQPLRAVIYALGRDVFFDAIALSAAFGAIGPEAHQRLSAQGEAWRPPVLPVSGRDVIAEGVAPGPDVARFLKTAEAAWIAEDFPGESRAREILKEIIAAR